MGVLEIVWNFEPRVIPSLRMPVWYGIMWALGFLFGLRILRKMYLSEDAPEKLIDHSFTYVLIGGVVGARLGHCLFYQADHYLSHPLELLKIWEGGLASHGGVVGVVVASYLLSIRYKEISVLWLLDRFVVPTALAAGLIRMGNLFNHEIVGRPTGTDFGFKFLRHDIPGQLAIAETGVGQNQLGKAYDLIAHDPSYAQWLASVPNRHPAQLYEAISYFLLFGVLMWVYWKTNAAQVKGLLLGVFFVLTFSIRFAIEFLKEHQEGVDQSLEGLNMGQYLSLPLIGIGLFLVLRHRKQWRRKERT